MSSLSDDELVCLKLSDDELVQHLHDDLYEGLKKEIEEGTQIGWQPSQSSPQLKARGNDRH